MGQHPLPNLQHKSAFAVPYWEEDGRHDCHFLSVGLAQWNQAHLSAKTLRHTGNKWSRQSEELPPSRLIDLTQLLAEASRFGSTGGSSISAEVFVTEPSLAEKVSRALNGDEQIQLRLHRLARRLNELGFGKE